MAFEKICTLDDVWEGEMERFHTTDGTGVLIVFPNGGEPIAFQDRCPHQQFDLATGKLENNVLTCRAHLWQFDATTGQGVNPADCRLAIYPTRVDGDDVFVDVAGIAPATSHT
jgi:toluene monooxygenase system ferredoxin subunit